MVQEVSWLTFFQWGGALILLAGSVILTLSTEKDEMSGKAMFSVSCLLIGFLIFLIASIGRTENEARGNLLLFSKIKDGDGYIAKEAKVVILEKDGERRIVEGLPQGVPFDKQFSIRDGKPFLLLQKNAAK